MWGSERRLLHEARSAMMATWRQLERDSQQQERKSTRGLSGALDKGAVEEREFQGWFLVFRLA